MAFIQNHLRASGDSRQGGTREEEEEEEEERSDQHGDDHGLLQPASRVDETRTQRRRIPSLQVPTKIPISSVADAAEFAPSSFKSQEQQQRRGWGGLTPALQRLRLLRQWGESWWRRVEQRSDSKPRLFAAWQGQSCGDSARGERREGRG